MPLATLVLGIAGAFTTTSMASSKSLADVNGRYFVDEDDPCHDSMVLCSDTFTTFGACTSGSITLWKLTSPGICQTPLYKRQP